MQRDVNKRRELGTVLITGGSGFVGQNFVRTLLDRGYRVRSLDQKPSPITHPNLEVMTGDIRDAALIRTAVNDIDTIFHTAAVIETKGGPAATQAYRNFSYDINVEATKQLAILARAFGVKRFVYTSSNSVVLDGKPQRGVDETRPYTRRARDLYTETKVVAEQWILQQNGIDGMLTCAIRPSSIWGPGDQTMFRKIFDQVLAGLMHAKIGNGSKKLDNTFVHNLIQGQIKAAEHLVEGGTAPGQAYFINDGEPINAFEFTRPVLEAIGCKVPRISIPGQWLVKSLEVWEYGYFKYGLPSPPLAASEAERVAVDNYFSIEKARRELGYEPEFDFKKGMELSLPYYIDLFNTMKLEKQQAKRAFA